MIITSPPQAAGSDTDIVPIIVPIVVILILVIIILIFVFRSGKKVPVYDVMVTEKVSTGFHAQDHPWEDRGYQKGYAVRPPGGSEFIPGLEITLERNKKYKFRMHGVSKDFPFYISSSDVGGGNGSYEYLRGVEDSPAIGKGTLTFTPSNSTPPTLYYQCTKQKCMGYKINIVHEGETSAESQSGDHSVISINKNKGLTYNPNDTGDEMEDEEAANGSEYFTGDISDADPTNFRKSTRNPVVDNSTIAMAQSPTSSIGDNERRAPSYPVPPVYDLAMQYRGQDGDQGGYNAPLVYLDVVGGNVTTDDESDSHDEAHLISNRPDDTSEDGSDEDDNYARQYSVI